MCLFCADMYNPAASGGGGGYYGGNPQAPAPGPADHGAGWQQYGGQQLLNDPMANMAVQYGSNLADQGKDLVNKKVTLLLFTMICNISQAEY